MEQYQNLVRTALANGTYKPNRTGVDTISSFSQHYKLDLENGYPLLTTKQMDGFRWRSMIHEFIWYLSGEEHIRNLREETSIWDAWADDNGSLDTAYGRFWRRYPIPAENDQLQGETWASNTEGRWKDNSDIDPERWLNEDDTPDGRPTFDQLQYIIDMLSENPYSRRLVVNAWHPANATVSTLPPCHFTFVFNVQGDRLNLQLTQRSADIALGVPFNIAAYALLLKYIAQRTGFEPGVFAHTLVDAHVYCGSGDRGEWYGENLSEIQTRIEGVTEQSEYLKIRDWIQQEAPEETTDAEDHVPNLLTQLSRSPMDRPTINIADKPLDELSYNDITLEDYDSHDGLTFTVAE